MRSYGSLAAWTDVEPVPVGRRPRPWVHPPMPASQEMGIAPDAYDVRIARP